MIDRYIDIVVSLVLLFGFLALAKACILGRPTHIDAFNPDAMSEEWRGRRGYYMRGAK